MEKLNKYLNYIVLYLVLILVFILVVYPLLYIFFGSFKTNSEILTGGVKLLPNKFISDNYKQAWKLANFDTYTLNSLYMTFFIIIGVLLNSTMGGYVFARGKFPGKNLLFLIFTSSMFIALGSMILYPQVMIAKFFHINKGLLGVIIIRIFSLNVANLYIVRSFMMSVPKELDEAATIDGCSFFRIYWNIVLPLLKPIIATIGLITFKQAWNDYLLPLVFTLSDKKQWPLVVGVVSLRSTGEAASSWNLMLAGTMISIIPMLVVYLILNQYFISGLTSGAVKA